MFLAAGPTLHSFDLIALHGDDGVIQVHSAAAAEGEGVFSDDAGCDVHRER